MARWPGLSPFFLLSDGSHMLSGMGYITDVARWLESIGLSEYVELFRENHINEEILHALTGDDLKELGVASFGHRKRLLDAIAAIGKQDSRDGRLAREPAR